MTPLDHLRRYIESDHDDPSDVRKYALEHRVEFAGAFGVDVDKYVKEIDGVGDEPELARRLLLTAKNRQAKVRAERAAERSVESQLAADALTASSHWKGGHAILDLPAVVRLSTRGHDLLVFRGEGVEIAVYARPLIEISKIKRGLTGWVDADGLHVRWATGGLNLTHRGLDAVHVATITINLPPRTQAAPLTPPAVTEEASVPAPRKTPERTPMKARKPAKPTTPATVEEIVESFQNACLEKVREMEAHVAASLKALTTERDAALGRENALTGELVAHKLRFGAECSERDARLALLTQQLSERDARIAGLVALVNAPNDATEPAEEDQSETIARLTAELEEAKAELAEADAGFTAAEKEAEELQAKLEELTESIPESEQLACVVHDFLRDGRFLPANLDMPLRVAHHDYRDGLSRAVGSELP